MKELHIDSIRVTEPDENGYVAIEVDKKGEPVCQPVKLYWNRIMDPTIQKIMELVADDYGLM